MPITAHLVVDCTANKEININKNTKQTSDVSLSVIKKKQKLNP